VDVVGGHGLHPGGGQHLQVAHGTRTHLSGEFSALQVIQLIAVEGCTKAEGLASKENRTGVLPGEEAFLAEHVDKLCAHF